MDGALTVEGVRYTKGDTVFVPAGYGAFTLSGEAKIVSVRI